MKQKLRVICAVLLTGVFALLAGGCAASQGSDSASDTTNTGSHDNGSMPAAVSDEIIVGTMATEDILPLWVAEAEGVFDELGINVRIETFQSAQELSTAVVSEAVDMAMTDIMVSATLEAAQTPVVLEWVTLGATPEQGRFGIMTSPDSGITSLKDLAGVAVGVGSCTVPEYVMDSLLAEAGLSESEIVSEEIKKVPVRYELMSANQVAAAALPGSFLALGEETGLVLLADDTKGSNLSQSVMIARESFAQSDAGRAGIELVAQAWDNAVARINENPSEYRALLIEKAQIADAVKDVYPLSAYPLAERPTSAMVDPVLEWMLKKGYLASALNYDASTGCFAS